MIKIAVTDMQAELINDRLSSIAAGGYEELLEINGISEQHMNNLVSACPTRQGIWFINNDDIQFLQDEVENLCDLHYDAWETTQSGRYKSLANLQAKLLAAILSAQREVT